MQFIPAVTLAISIAVFLRASRHYAAARYGVSQRYATYWPRLWACLVDGFALWPLSILELLALRTGLGPRPAGASLLLCAWAPWLYAVGGHALRGATLGQEICRVRLLDVRGERAIGWGRAWLREAPGLAAALLCSGFILGQLASDTFRATGTPAVVLASLFPAWTLLEIASLALNRQHRAFSDLLAGTVVVRTNAEPARRAQAPAARSFEGHAA